MLVSVCTIARNEEEYLPHLLEDITKQDYPAEQIEVVMVDSSSTDGTRRIMERFAEENYEELVEINFKQIPSAMDIFSSDLKVDNMVMAMSVFDDGKCKSIR